MSGSTQLVDHHVEQVEWIIISTVLGDKPIGGFISLPFRYHWTLFVAVNDLFLLFLLVVMAWLLGICDSREIFVLVSFYEISCDPKSQLHFIYAFLAYGFCLVISGWFCIMKWKELGFINSGGNSWKMKTMQASYKSILPILKVENDP